MAEGLNTYQLAGLVGTGLSQIMSAGSMYAQGGMQVAQANIQAGAMDSTGILSSAQTMIESDLNQILREAEQADLMYQSQVQQIGAEQIATQIEMVRAKGSYDESKMLKNLNKSESTVVMQAIAQGRSGATIENIRRQNRAEADRDIKAAKSLMKMDIAQLTAEEAKALAGSKISVLAAQSSKATAVFEKKVAESTAKYQKVSGAIQAKAMRDQAKYSSRMATAGAIGSIAGAGLSLGMMYGGIGAPTKGS